MKKCTKCFEFKPTEEFHRQKKSADSHETRCKECRNEGERHRRFLKIQSRQIENVANDIDYNIPQIKEPNYIERLATLVATKKMALDELKFDLKYVVDGKKKYYLVLNLLRQWKQTKDPLK